MSASFFVGPVVGGIIGYITNNIAIKMLFRPLKPIYIGGKRLPCTPGMIPREQERLAKTIGAVVDKELIDPKILQSYLLSQEMYISIENCIHEWLKDKKTSNITVQQYINEFASEKVVDSFVEALEEKITQGAYVKLKESNIADPIVEQMEKTIKESIGPLSMFIGESFIESTKVKIKDMIQEMIEIQGEELIGDLVEKNIEDFLDKPLSEAVEILEKEMNKVKYILLKSYTQFVENNLEQVLASINFASIVEEKIKTYDAKKMEQLILSVVKKELNAIVWLGALLGAIMGLVVNLI